MADMKIQFVSDLDYQEEALSSVVGLFDGQEVCRASFTVSPMTGQLGLEDTDLGIGNRLRLLDDEVLENVKAIQLRNGLAPSATLGGMHFSVEMETGTGKTYVYLRTLFELNRRFGFTKFIIVVPSVAIKEGVHKSLQITEDHFKGLYGNVAYDYFVYDSQKLGQVRNFATSDAIQIMVINIDAFRKSFDDPERENKANIIHRPQDRMSGTRPIEFIRATNPIVIIDEPQSVDSTPKSKEAIASLNPLCTLRYSATHVDKHNMMYRLDSVDAYQRKLVKQIEVASVQADGAHNTAYIRLLKVDNTRGPITAQIEIDSSSGGAVSRKRVTVRQGDDLLELSGGRDVYDGYIIEDIYCAPGEEYISFTSNSQIVRLNEAAGDVDQDQYKRLQIRKTIEEHLDKELLLRPQGIKVLSLFFIDRVANYRDYDEDGNPQLGKYAVMFEEEYARAIRKPKYNPLFGGPERDVNPSEVHDGYFAQDKRGGRSIWKDSSGEGKTAADESAYQLIMKDKERLLGLDEPLKFIWSHSALKEGWDNPNVFQICTLNETASVMKKRQEIGRGMRICVNQAGERVYGFDVNTLTVIANESYSDFAHALQREIERDEGIKFGVVEKHLFASIPVIGPDGETAPLGTSASATIWDHLMRVGYLDVHGKVQDALRRDLKTSEVSLPDEYEDVAPLIVASLTKVAGSLNIRNADDRRQAKLNKVVYLSPEFRELWDKIKYRTTFRVDFDSEALIEKCATEINQHLVVGAPRFRIEKGRLDIDLGGVVGEVVSDVTATYEAGDIPLPDIVSYLQDETSLTRRSIVAILTRCGRLDDFKKNPQKFIEEVTKTIKGIMQTFIVDGIKYHRIGDDSYYAQELFEQEELFGYFEKNMLEAQKSVFDHVVYDSDVELEFAKRFELSDDVKVYAKLPGWFKIDTPLGGYNPDWAVLVERDGEQRLYFVIETKGSLFTTDLRPKEQAKIDCGRAHFRALEDGAEYTVTNSYDSFIAQFG